MAPVGTLGVRAIELPHVLGQIVLAARHEYLLTAVH